MLHLLTFRVPMENGNAALRDPNFGRKLNELLTDIKAKDAYFTTVNGCRGGYIIVDIKDASDMPAIAEPLFMWLNAEVTSVPVMQAADLQKAGPSIGAAIEKWAPK